MDTAREFEDLVAWQRARVLTRLIYEYSDRGSFARDFPLRDQLRRAATSVMANLAEGFDRSRPREFHQFLSIAKASCAEVRSHLYIALDAGHLAQNEFIALMRETRRVTSLIVALRSVVRQRCGPKYAAPKSANT